MGNSGVFRVAPGRDGQGLLFELTPGYGGTDSDIQQLWEDNLVDSEESQNTRDDYDLNLKMRLDYGLSPHDMDGLLILYAETALADSENRYRLGLRWKMNNKRSLDLLGEHETKNVHTASNVILLKGSVQF